MDNHVNCAADDVPTGQDGCQGGAEPQAPAMTPINPTTTVLRLDSAAMAPRAQPGNAFSRIKSRGSEGSKLPRKSTANLSPLSPIDGTGRPHIPRKVSHLEYDETLALPMPKPRSVKPWDQENSPASGAGSSKPNFSKKRAVTDPLGGKSVSIPSELSTSSGLSPSDGRKLSKLELIKSKLSFKDLRKESLKDESLSLLSPLSSKETPKTSPRRVVTGTSLPSASPSSHRLKLKAKSSEQPSSIPARFHAISPTVSKGATTRIPLPPSATSINVQGAISSTQLANGPGDHFSPNATASSCAPQRVNERSGVAFSTQGRYQPDVVVTRPSLDAVLRKYEPSTPTVPVPKYPVTDDSPPRLTDLCEGDGKVKYLPRHWLEGTSSNSPSDKGKRHIHSSHDGDNTDEKAITDRLPTYKERLGKANMPLDQPVSFEIQNRTMPMEVDDIVDMIRSIQRQADASIGSIGKKLEDVSHWISDQLKNHIESISDLGCANSELFAKQCQISREIMKFQLDIRLEIGVMERRLDVFEGKLLDELQGELRTLTRSYEDLLQKTEALLGKHSGDNNKLIEEQRQRNVEIEHEIAYLERQHDAPMNRSPLPVGQRHSVSSIGSAEPLIKQVMPVRAPGYPASSAAAPVIPRLGRPAVENRGIFPRSVSLTKKGLLKGIKDITSSPESKEKATLAKPASNEETKKWSVFSFRRRRDATDASRGESKFPRASARLSKEVTPREEAVSSRSSTPPLPPVPRPFSRPPTSSPAPPLGGIHPALVNLETTGNVVEDTSVTTTPNTSDLGLKDMPSHRNDCPNRGTLAPTTCCQAWTSVSGNKDSFADTGSLEQSFHSGIQEHHPDHRAGTNGANEEASDSALLGDENNDWDRVSLRESRSHGTAH